MKKILLICFIQLLATSFSFSQQAEREFKTYRDSIQKLPGYDSLSFFKLVNKLNGIAKSLHSASKEADVLHIIGTYYFFQKNFGKTNLYYDSALSILKDKPDIKLQNLINLKRSFIWIDKGNFEAAKTYYNNQEPLFTEQKDSLALILLNMARGQIYQAELRNDESIKYMYKALNLAVLSKEYFYEATCRNNLGGEYQVLGKTEQAKNEFYKALDITKKGNNLKLMASINGNLASIYIQENKFGKALAIYHDILAFYEKSDFYYEMSYVYLNMAYCFAVMQNKDMMTLYGKKSLDTLAKHHLPVDAINVYSQVIGFYEQNNLYKEVIALSKEANTFSSENHIPIIDPTFYHNISKAYEKTGDYPNALLMHQKYATLKDSISEATNMKQLNELTSKYELAEKEQKIKIKENENELLRKENELSALSKTYYVIIGLMLIALIIFLAFGMVQRNLKKQKDNYAVQLINDIDKERERIAMDLHDEIGLGITMVRHKIAGEQQVIADKKQDIEKSLQDLLEQTRKISRDLFPAPLKHIRFEEFLDELLKNIEAKTGIICSYEITPKIDNYNLDVKMHILRIVQECLHNSIKYSSAKAIRIEAVDLGKKTQIVYQDNGIGLKDNMKGNGLGMQNIQQRAKQIGADVQMSKNENNTGIKLILTIYDEA